MAADSLCGQDPESQIDLHVVLDPVVFQQSTNLSKDDFLVFEDGKPQVIDRVVRITSGQVPTSDNRRFFILSFGHDLSYREQFKARRAARKMVDHLEPGRDSVAILRNDALSGFREDRPRIQQLIEFFATPSDRFNTAPPALDTGSSRPYWFGSGSKTPLERPGAFWGSSETGTTLLLERLLQAGSYGSFGTLLSTVRYLPGRKILIHFGRTLPFGDADPEQSDARAASRLVGESGATVIAVTPRPVDEEDRQGQAYLRAWANTAVTLMPEGSSAGLEQMAHAVLKSVADYYLLRYTSSREPDGHFRQVNVRLKTGADRVYHRNGYFATVDEPTHLRGRTYLTALREIDRFHDFPVTLNLDPVASLGVDVTVLFPFQSIQMELVGGSSESEQNLYFQRLKYFLAVFDEERQLLAYREGYSGLSIDAQKLSELRRANARIDERLTAEEVQNARSVAIVLVTGQNRQIATEVTELAPN